MKIPQETVNIPPLEALCLLLKQNLMLAGAGPLRGNTDIRTWPPPPPAQSFIN